MNATKNVQRKQLFHADRRADGRTGIKRIIIEM